MTFDSRLAMAAMRGVVAELETTPDLAREVLARLLTPASTLGTVTTSPAPTKVIQCDAKQGRPKPGRPSKRPAARRAKRPAPAAPSREPTVSKEHGAEARRLVVELLEAHGNVSSASEASGFARVTLRRWKRGASTPTPESLERLRAAAAEVAAATERKAGKSARAAAKAAGLSHPKVRSTDDPPSVEQPAAKVECLDGKQRPAARTKPEEKAKRQEKAESEPDEGQEVDDAGADEEPAGEGAHDAEAEA